MPIPGVLNTINMVYMSCISHDSFSMAYATSKASVHTQSDQILLGSHVQ